MGGSCSPRPITDEATRLRGVAGVIFLGFFIASLIGCAPAYEVRVPDGFAIPSNMSDLHDAITLGDGVSGREVAIVPHENETHVSFEICGSRSGGRMCRELAFTDTGLERAIDEVIDAASERSRVERIVIVTDYRRRSLCDRFERNADGGTVVSGGTVSISCTSRSEDEALEGFIDTIVERVNTTTDLVVSILAEDSITVIRRLGSSREDGVLLLGEDAREDAAQEGGVVPELLLPGSGARLRAAGYPIPASIAYDFSEVFPVTGANGGDSAPVYVPYAVFRY